MKKKSIKRIRKIRVFNADNRIAIKKLADNSVDSIVTDPPYALVSIVKRFGKKGSAPAKGNETFMRASRGFMGQLWDTGEVTNDPLFWAECLRVLKPGGHLLAFGGTRTYHRMVCAIEDAGFDIRDMIQWLYGSGFPKSHDVSKGIDKAAGRKRKIIRKRYTVKRIKPGATVVREGAWGKQEISYTATDTAPASKESAKWQGYGTALKPANEPIVLARKPLSEKTVAANVLKWGTGAINVDGCRVDGTPRTTHARGNVLGSRAGQIVYGKLDAGFESSGAEGRWPANVITDGSDEVIAMFPESKSAGHIPRSGGSKAIWSNGREIETDVGSNNAFADSGSAARFFYQAKANKLDRAGSRHPTVKPIALMQYLIRLVTPKNGLVLDPFAGTGTTAEAADMEGCKIILMENNKKYQKDIKRRLQKMRVRKSRQQSRKRKQ